MFKYTFRINSVIFNTSDSKYFTETSTGEYNEYAIKSHATANHRFLLMGIRHIKSLRNALSSRTRDRLAFFTARMRNSSSIKRSFAKRPVGK